jgi:hypothetical protein
MVDFIFENISSFCVAIFAYRLRLRDFFLGVNLCRVLFFDYHLSPWPDLLKSCRLSMTCASLQISVPNAISTFVFRNWNSATFISRLSHLSRARFNWDALRTYGRERIRFVCFQNPRLKAISLPGSVTLLRIIESLPQNLEELEYVSNFLNRMKFYQTRLLSLAFF